MCCQLSVRGVSAVCLEIVSRGLRKIVRCLTKSLRQTGVGDILLSLYLSRKAPCGVLRSSTYPDPPLGSEPNIIILHNSNNAKLSYSIYIAPIFWCFLLSLDYLLTKSVYFFFLLTQFSTVLPPECSEIVSKTSNSLSHNFTSPKSVHELLC